MAGTDPICLTVQIPQSERAAMVALLDQLVASSPADSTFRVDAAGSMSIRTPDASIRIREDGHDSYEIAFRRGRVLVGLIALPDPSDTPIRMMPRASRDAWAWTIARNLGAEARRHLALAARDEDALPRDAELFPRLCTLASAIATTTGRPNLSLTLPSPWHGVDAWTFDPDVSGDPAKDRTTDVELPDGVADALERALPDFFDVSEHERDKADGIPRIRLTPSHVHGRAVDAISAMRILSDPGAALRTIP